MQDWRLDSASGGNDLPLGATVCAVGRQWASDRVMRAGGGAAAHTFIILDKVCEKHVLVVGGRTYERGFTVNREGMYLLLSKAIPWVGRVFVLGFGRVIREKRPSDWVRVRPVEEHFPVAKGINAGHHPYEWMPASSKYADPANGTGLTTLKMYPYARNHVAAARVNRPQLRDVDRMAMSGSAAAPAPDNFYTASMQYAWGRATPYDAYGFAANGACLRLDVSAGVIYETGATVPLDKVSAFAGAVYTRARGGQQARHLYFGTLLPDEDGNLYAMPRIRGCPVLKIPAPNYDDIVDLGPDTADQGVAYKDPFAADNQGGTAFSDGDYSIFIRLFDGRMLGFPMYLYSGTVNNSRNLLLFDPVTATSETIPLPAKDSEYGISRWILPVQAADGKVYARPSTAPGNLTLIFDPVTKQIELDDFGHAPQRMDMRYTNGVPCANGKIYYCQTLGAAVDINQFLVLDTANRTCEVVDLGFVHSTVLPFLSAMALSDGCPMFMGPSGLYSSHNTTITNIDKGYNRLIYDPWKDDFVLYRSLPFASADQTWRTWYYYNYRSAAGADTVAVNDLSRDRADWKWEYGPRFLLPEFSLMTMDYPRAHHPNYTCHYLETPPQLFPGTYCRQAFFGTCS